MAEIVCRSSKQTRNT